MTRRILALCTLVIGIGLFSSGAVPARAGAQRWSAWMFNHQIGQMLLLTDGMNGVPQTLALPMPTGFNTYGRTVAISHDWHYMAYVVTNSGTNAKAIVVYDRNAHQITYTLPLQAGAGVSLEFSADEGVFNETSTAFAFGYSINNMTGWEIKAIQLGVGAGIPTLRGDNPAVKALGIGAKFMGPVIRRYRGSDVTFNMIHLASEGAPQYDSYAWNIASGEVRRDDAYPSLPTDTLWSTGETVSPAIDSRLPSCGDACGPFFMGNTLVVYDVAANARYPFYNAPEMSLFRALFIQNGERVLFNGTKMSASDQSAWSVVERNGGLVGNLPSGAAIDSVIGWQDGYLYMPPIVNPSGGPSLFVVNTRNGLSSDNPVFQGAQGTDIHLLQTPSNMQSTGPFTAWKQLAPPVSSAAVAPSGGGTGKLTVGKQAIVNTTQGDKLRLRSGPGTSFAVLALLDKGTMVTLLEGPRQGDGLTWWRIRTPSGTEGWVIESIDDNGQHIETLIPA